MSNGNVSSDVANGILKAVLVILLVVLCVGFMVYRFRNHAVTEHAPAAGANNNGR